jgi:hypothetical protein
MQDHNIKSIEIAVMLYPNEPMKYGFPYEVVNCGRYTFSSCDSNGRRPLALIKAWAEELLQVAWGQPSGSGSSG